MLKNTSGQTFTVVAFNASGKVTGNASAITCTLAIDNGTRVALTDVNPVEIAATGVYEFDLTQGETNGHKLSFVPASSTSGVEVLGSPSNVIYTTVPATSGSGGTLADNLSVIYIGDDYVAGNGRQIYVDAVPGYTPVACKFGGAGRGGSWLVNGAISSIGGGSFRAAFNLDATDTADLGPGDFTVSVELVDADGEEHTVLQKDIPVRRKQT